jgi:hypothetical protein
MPTFDGSIFEHIDDDAYGDGNATESGATRPLDTMLEHSVRNNTSYLRQNRNPSISWTPNSDRFISPLEWSTVHWMMYPLEPSIEELRSDVLVEWKKSQTEGGDRERDGEIRMKIIGAPGQSGTFAEDEADFLSTTGTNALADATLSVTFGSDDITTRRWVAVMWQIRMGGRASSTIKGKKDDIDVRVEPDGLVFTTYKEDLGLGPSGALRFFSLDFTGPELVTLELQSNYQDGDSATNTEDVYTSPQAYRAWNDVGLVSSEKTFVVSDFNAVGIRGISLEESHRDDLGMSSRQIAGGIPYESQQSAYQQAEAITDTYETLRPVAMGWGGDLRDSSTEWGDQPTYFGYHYGNPQSGDPDNFRGTVKLDTRSYNSDIGQLHIRFFTLAAHLLNPYIEGRDSDFKLSDLKDESGSITFDLTVTVTDAQSSTTIGSQTESYNIDLYPSDHTGRWPVLQMLHFANKGDANNSPSSGDFFDVGSTIHTYREGTVRERELGLWRPKQIEVPLDDNTFSREDPLRWEFSASITDYQQEPIVTKPERNVLVFSGPSLFERPR